MSKLLRDLEPTRPLVDWERLQRLRLERATALMAAANVDGLLVNTCENVIYLTNWPRWGFGGLFANSFSALYPAGAAEAVAFCLQADAKDVINNKLFSDFRSLESDSRTWIKDWAAAIGAYLPGERTIGLDPGMPGALYEGIKQALPGVNFVNAGGLLARIRMVKNEEEIKAYEHALAIMEAGINLAIKMAKESWGRYTEVEIAAAASYEVMKRGAARTNYWCPTGDNAAATKRYSTDQPVRGGEFMLVDGGGYYHGLRAEFARPVWTGGQPSSEQVRAYRTIFETHTHVKEMLKPGVTTGQVDRVIMDVVRAAGYERYFGGYPYTGHGIGVASEPPYFSESHPQLDIPIEAGMMFNLEPALWYPGVGGIRIEDTYLVTPDGFRILSRAPYEEELLA